MCVVFSLAQLVHHRLGLHGRVVGVGGRVGCVEMVCGGAGGGGERCVCGEWRGWGGGLAQLLYRRVDLHGGPVGE